MPSLPDHWAVNEAAGGEPLQARDLARAQLPQFELHADADFAVARQRPPEVMLHPADAARLGLLEGDIVGWATGAARPGFTPASLPKRRLAC